MKIRSGEGYSLRLLQSKFLRWWKHAVWFYVYWCRNHDDVNRQESLSSRLRTAPSSSSLVVLLTIHVTEETGRQEGRSCDFYILEILILTRGMTSAGIYIDFLTGVSGRREILTSWKNIIHAVWVRMGSFWWWWCWVFLRSSKSCSDVIDIDSQLQSESANCITSSSRIVLLFRRENQYSLFWLLCTHTTWLLNDWMNAVRRMIICQTRRSIPWMSNHVVILVKAWHQISSLWHH